jgi:hypothetical protein
MSKSRLLIQGNLQVLAKLATPRSVLYSYFLVVSQDVDEQPVKCTDSCNADHAQPILQK